MRQISCLLLILTAVLTNNIFASQQSELAKITARITSLKKYLVYKKTKKDNLTTELGRAEKQISDINFNLRKINKKIAAQQIALQPLQKKQTQYQRKLAAQRSELAKQLQIAYQIGQYGYLQLFLSQQQPSDIDRMSVYYQMINQARAKLIKQFLQNLQQINDNQAAISKTLSRLQQLKQSRVVVRKQLKQRQQQRQQLIVRLDAQINTSNQRIARLQADKQHLQNIVNNLNAEKAYQKFSGIAFASLQHRLPWPVSGKIARKYGQLYDGRLVSNGVFITASLNTAVRTIAAGKIIFSNWLRGYGNLIIVSHGGGYMTLYAHNNSLVKQVGELVKAGEEIAIVGNSGGLATPGLYFEIRDHGKTRDPALWCTPKSK